MGKKDGKKQGDKAQDGEAQDGQTARDGQTQDGQIQDGQTQDGQTQDNKTKEKQNQKDKGRCRTTGWNLFVAYFSATGFVGTYGRGDLFTQASAAWGALPLAKRLAFAIRGGQIRRGIAKHPLTKKLQRVKKAPKVKQPPPPPRPRRPRRALPPGQSVWQADISMSPRFRVVPTSPQTTFTLVSSTAGAVDSTAEYRPMSSSELYPWSSPTATTSSDSPEVEVPQAHPQWPHGPSQPTSGLYAPDESSYPLGGGLYGVHDFSAYPPTQTTAYPGSSTQPLLEAGYPPASAWHDQQHVDAPLFDATTSDARYVDHCYPPAVAPTHMNAHARHRQASDASAAGTHAGYSSWSPLATPPMPNNYDRTWSAPPAQSTLEPYWTPRLTCGEPVASPAYRPAHWQGQGFAPDPLSGAELYLPAVGEPPARSPRYGLREAFFPTPSPSAASFDSPVAAEEGRGYSPPQAGMWRAEEMRFNAQRGDWYDAPWVGPSAQVIPEDGGYWPADPGPSGSGLGDTARYGVRRDSPEVHYASFERSESWSSEDSAGSGSSSSTGAYPRGEVEDWHDKHEG